MTRKNKSVFVILWRYRVRRGSERQFERIYGPRGAWARFFRKGRGYRGTQLLRIVGASQSYLTADLWTSRAAFGRFHRRHHREYARIDRQCEELTKSEVKIGAYTIRL